MDDALLARAITLSREKMRTVAGGPFGAVVARDGQVIAEGWNMVASENDPTAHAEIVALRRAARKLGTFDLSGCTLYASTEPCPMCYGAAHWARIERIVYANDRQAAAEAGFDDALLHEQVALPAHARAIEMVHTPHEDALAVIAEWRTKPDKVSY
ncbi:MAG TPA: nucleoside deaminase [Sneathiellales bacterium]|nr:nucleoside deaminase [Sneathiellales bacterium]